MGMAPRKQVGYRSKPFPVGRRAANDRRAANNNRNRDRLQRIIYLIRLEIDGIAAVMRELLRQLSELSFDGWF